MRATLFLFLLLIINHGIQAQEKPTVDVQQIIDDIFGSQELDLNYDQLYENLMLLLSDPIDLNTATEEQLRFLGFLSEYQISAFKEYKSTNGKFISVYELQAIPGFDLITINRLAPFITVDDPNTAIDKSLFQRALKNKNNYILFRYEHLFEEKKGFSDQVEADKKFLGSPDRMYLRYRNNRPGDFSVGLTLEKDAGEDFRWEPMKQVGFDFLSFHGQVMNKGKLKNLIVGDYQVQAAQGLVLGGLFGMGKGGETIASARKSNVGGMPYTSSAENAYLRGALATYELTKHFYLTGFISNAKRDASLTVDSLENSSISSLQTTGLHRNKSELKGKDAINETNIGSIINFKNQKMDVGVIWNAIDFNTSFNRNPSPYNQFAFNSQTHYNVSLYANFNYHNFTFFNEAAKSLKGGVAIISGLLGSITPQLDIAMVYRNYQRDYHTFYSNAFGESSIPQNETGLYWGWKYKWNKKFSFAGYVDWFRFPWLRYRSYAPSEGYEWLLRFNYQINRNTLLYVQVREESKVRNISGTETPLYHTDQGVKRNFLLNVQLPATKSLQFKTRIQGSTFHFNDNTTSGLALMQDIKWDIGKFSLAGRYTLFDTDDYDNRQYVYENDVWLAFSFPAYEGKGVRNYLMLAYKFNRHFSLWTRYSYLRFTDREEIGSGYDLIPGNKRNDIKFQLKIVL